MGHSAIKTELVSPLTLEAPRSLSAYTTSAPAHSSQAQDVPIRSRMYRRM